MKIAVPNDIDRRVGDLIAEYNAKHLCLADALCDRHPADSVAFTIVEDDLTSRDLTYAELADRSRRLASALVALGVGPGDRVATLMTKSADLVVTMLAIWRCGAVYVPLFTAFAAPAVAMRLDASDARVVVVDAGQRHKLGDTTRRVLVAGGGGRSDDIDFEATIAAHEPQRRPQRLGGEAPFVRLFTSGTTGDPKAVVIRARALAAMVAYQEFGLDVRPSDVFWNAADPGWAYGLYYAIVAPLATGTRSLLLHAAFSADLTYRVLARFAVTNFAAAPTVYRALRNDAAARPQTLALRACSSAGEPLGADLVTWARETLGVPVYDQYGQTELGMAVVNAHPPALEAPLKPGSMGRAMPGWSVTVLEQDGDAVAAPGELGRVAVVLHESPLMWFEEYANAPERTAERFLDGRYYLTGDAGSMDREGYVFFSSRDADVIIMAGYRIGPFEIESVLQTHPAVAETAVIGVPDALRGEVVEAFVVLRPGFEASPALTEELQRHVKEGFAAHAYPRTVHFTSELPKTPSGKLQRFLLRAERRSVEIPT
ncbi:MAG: AMP-binding protein [Candidatus Eremiobacteraeota bacterium]|nr:AMP-binding protein [Candidatus Eremiobacteraeota bacterium]